MKTTCSRVSELFCLLAAIYATSAVLYTTNYFFLGPLQSHILPLAGYHRRSSAMEAVQPKFTNWTAYLESESLRGRTPSWDVSRKDVYSMSESLFMSKAFSASYSPTQVIPYFYRACGRFDQEDITITTLITSDRLEVFARMVERYQGDPTLIALRLLLTFTRTCLCYHTHQEHYN